MSLPPTSLTGRFIAGAVAGLFALNGFAAQQKDSRPPEDQRKFKSEAVEELIEEVKGGISDPSLRKTFENAFPNTLDTTVTYREVDGVPDTYIITGDIDAMWLRDSTAQVSHYLPLAKKDEKLRKMIEGLIRRQTRCILLDPYANAFYGDPDKVGEWASDHTDMKPGVHERKWELDSLSYAIRLAYLYWKETGDTAPFDQQWLDAMNLAVKTMIEQQRKEDKGPYSFMRTTQWQTDTVPGNGFGNPMRPTGMICSTFRNSDDAATFLFNIPENLFAVVSLRQLAEMLDAMKKDPQLAARALELANEVEAAVKEHGIVEHPKHGKIYAYEVDGFGNALFIDDAGLPSLISIPYLGYGSIDDEIYQATRKFVYSPENPYFYDGKAAKGTGSAHLARFGDSMIWPMGISSRALTTNDPEEIAQCIAWLNDNTGGTHFMHEGFNKDDGDDFTRPWFAWSNSLFGEMIWKTYREHPEVLKK